MFKINTAFATNKSNQTSCFNCDHLSLHWGACVRVHVFMCTICFIM